MMKEKSQKIKQENDDEFLKVKSIHQANPNEKKILTVTKNRMKKIRNEGLFDGKNKIHFDEDLKPIEDEEYLKMKYLQDNEKNMQMDRDFTINKEINREFDEQYEKERRKQKRRKITEQKQVAKGDLLPAKSKQGRVAQLEMSEED